MNLYTWAARWGLPAECVRDLQTELGIYTPPLPSDAPGAGKSEAWTLSVVRLEASRKGVTLWRNNCGALTDSEGRLVRYGLANDSKEMSKRIKSGDLIGWRSVLIEPRHVGHVIAQFISREAKPPGWQYTGTPREVAQLTWANTVNAAGGDAAFATGEGTL